MLNNTFTMAEPNPNCPPVRVWIDGSPPIAESLAEVRIIMADLTVQLVETLDQRCVYAVGAAVFKKIPDEVRAPDQQVRNIDNAVELAKQRRPDSPAFHAMIRDVMAIIVPASVDMQMEAFEHTVPIGDQRGS